MAAARSVRLSVVLVSCVYPWPVGEDSIGPAVLAEEAAGQVIFSAYPRRAIRGHVRVAFTAGTASRGLFARKSSRPPITVRPLAPAPGGRGHADGPALTGGCGFRGPDPVRPTARPSGIFHIVCIRH